MNIIKRVSNSCSCLVLVRRFKSINVQNEPRVRNFETDFVDFRIPVSDVQRLILGVGSSVMSLLNPYRAGMNCYSLMLKFYIHFH